MKSLFRPADRETILARLAALQPEANRHWGKMNPAQMMCHCARALEMATTDQPVRQSILGRILMPFIRSSILGDKPFGRNSPTDPRFVVADAREFTAERTRLLAEIDRFVTTGEESAARHTHSFFGRLTGDEWGWVMYKHLDHHLQQFGG